MLMDEVANELLDKRMKLKEESPDPDYRPNLAVYMTQEYYMDCMREIHGPVSASAAEFISYGTLLGHPVFLIRANPHHTTISHPSYDIAIRL